MACRVFIKHELPGEGPGQVSVWTWPQSEQVLFPILLCISGKLACRLHLHFGQQSWFSPTGWGDPPFLAVLSETSVLLVVCCWAFPAIFHFKFAFQDFPGGSAVENQPSDEGTGSVPGLGRFYMLQNN